MGFSPDERRFVIGGEEGGVYLLPTDPLPAVKAHLPRALSAEERKTYLFNDFAVTP